MVHHPLRSTYLLTLEPPQTMDPRVDQHQSMGVMHDDRFDRNVGGTLYLYFDVPEEWWKVWCGVRWWVPERHVPW